MIELRITGETPQAFLEQLVITHAAMTFHSAVVKVVRPSADQNVGSVEESNNTNTTTEAVATEAPAEVKKPGRKKKDEPAPEAVEAKQVADETTVAAEEIEVPKDLDGMRALLGRVLQKFGVESVNAIVHPHAPVLSKVSVDKYPEIARLAHKKLAGDAA